MLTTLKQLETLLDPTTKRVVAVVCPDEESINALSHPTLKEAVTPIFFGDEARIREYLKQDQDLYEIVACDDERTASKRAVSSVKEGTSDVLMKGFLQTRDFLSAIVDSNEGIVEGRMLTHIAVNEIPTYHKLLITSDGGMVVKPDLMTKQVIARNALEVAQRLGILKPNIAILSATEHVNEKSKDSVEARKVQEFLEVNYPNACYAAGPLSLDLALSRDIAQKKRFEHPVAGNADILIGSSIDMMNVLGKSITTLANGTMAGIIWGAKVPIVMTSRGSSSDEKLYSMMLALATCEERL